MYLKDIIRGVKSVKILSCGAGQQSTALALMSCENALSDKLKYPLVPIYDAVLFCNLGGEREWVYKQVDFIAKQCGMAKIPFYALNGMVEVYQFRPHMAVSCYS